MRQPEYLNKELASKRSGLSVRRLLELAARGQVRKRFVRDPKSKRNIAVFDARDIVRLKDGENPSSSLQISRSGANVDAAMPHPSNAGIIVLETKGPAPKPLFLTLEEAELYSGLPATHLRNLIVHQMLPACDVGVRPGGRWRIARHALDRLAEQPNGIIIDKGE